MNIERKQSLDILSLKLMVGMIGQRLFSKEDRADMRSSVDATMRAVYAEEDTRASKEMATYVHMTMDEILDVMETIEVSLAVSNPERASKIESQKGRK